MILALFAFVLGAQAQNLYVNGTPVEGLKNKTFTNVTVEVDEHGDIYIIAPQYKVSLGEEADKAKQRRRKKDVIEAPMPPGTSDVAANRWWLITEDNKSEGHVIDVELNGIVVRTVRSGGDLVVFDMGPYLRSGNNDIRFISRGDSPGGGALFIYLGTGSVDGGKVSQNRPEIIYKRNSQSESRRSVDTQTLVVD